MQAKNELVSHGPAFIELFSLAYYVTIPFIISQLLITVILITAIELDTSKYLAIAISLFN